MALLPSYLQAELVRGSTGRGVLIDGTDGPALPDELDRHVVAVRPGPATDRTTCLVAAYRWVLRRGVEPQRIAFKLSARDRATLIAKLRHSGDPLPEG